MECQYIIVYIFCEFNIHRISFRLKPLHVCRVNVMQNFYLYKFRSESRFSRSRSLSMLRRGWQGKLGLASSVLGAKSKGSRLPQCYIIKGR